MRQHFGLGAATKVDSLQVLWPDGTTTERRDVEANQLVVIEQPGNRAPRRRLSSRWS